MGALEARIGSRVDRVVGGASYQELKAAEHPSVGLSLRIDYPTGLVTNYNATDVGALAAIVPAEFISTAGAPPVDRPDMPEGGDQLYVLPPGTSSYASVCTVGFTYEGGGTSGFVTAGHCPDWDAYVDGWYSSSPTPVHEGCTGVGGDYQAINFQTQASGPGETIFMKDASYPHVPFEVAGGWYVGQMIQLARRVTISSWGEITGWDSWIYDEGECTSGSFSGIRYTNASSPGDSGGSLLVNYYNDPYLIGIHNSSGATTRGGTTRNYISIPSGTQICSLSNFCI